VEYLEVSCSFGSALDNQGAVRVLGSLDGRRSSSKTLLVGLRFGAGNIDVLISGGSRSCLPSIGIRCGRI
jgi:hypothetical protein